MVTYAFNPSSWVAEAKCQATQGYIVRPYLEKVDDRGKHAHARAQTHILF